MLFSTVENCQIEFRRGFYLLEGWGAQGGQGLTNAVQEKNHPGGLGAYVKGNITIHNKLITYLHIGGKGEDAYLPNHRAAGGANGGGSGGQDDGDDDDSGGGGGSTDLRLQANTLDDRILVAAGGSGSGYACSGAPGGTINGYKRDAVGNLIVSTNTDQTHGYQKGVGAPGINSNVPGDTTVSGGGGGLMGGRAGVLQYDHDFCLSISDSGSSYISGYSGCKQHRSGIVFTDTQMKSGTNSGNGKFQITLKKDYPSDPFSKRFPRKNPKARFLVFILFRIQEA